MKGKISTQLLGMIRSKLDAAKLMSKFNRTYKKCSKSKVSYHFISYNNSCRCDVYYYLPQFLLAAAKFNHTELVTALFADIRFDGRSAVAVKHRILFVAIQAANIKLVEVFLRAGISSHTKAGIYLTFEKETPWHVSGPVCCTIGF